MIIIKNDREIELIARGGKILANILDELEKAVRPGISTLDLENLAVKLIKEAGGRPSFLGYRSSASERPFPTALCTSINDEVVHAPAIPPRILKEGDIIGIDIGMEYPLKQYRKPEWPLNPYSKEGGYFTDMARTVAVGKISNDLEKLIQVTKKSLDLAIEIIKPGINLREIGRVIQGYVEKRGFAVVRDLVGHGVGVKVHEDPQIPNYFIPDKSYDIKLKPGMVIAIEPMVNMGDWRVKCGADCFTIKTIDGKPSAHFEHTIAITKNECLVATK